MSSRLSWSEQQPTSKCWRSPGVSWLGQSRQDPAGLVLLHFLQNQSEGYWPLRSLETTNDLLDSKGLHLEVVHRGCGFNRLINFGLKNSSEVLVCASASYLLFQKNVIFDFTMCLVGGLRRSERGDWRPYWVQRCLTWTNHDDEESGSEDILFMAILCRILSGRRVIIPKSPNCLMWRLAVAPIDPARNMTKHSGVFRGSFWRLSRVFLWWEWRMLISAFVSVNAETPDSKTGRA